MSLPTTVLRQRQWALRSFIASLGRPSTVQAAPQRHQRAFSRSVYRSNEARERFQQDSHVLNEINDIPNNPAPDSQHQQAQPPSQPSDAAQQEPGPIPWYLRVRPQPQPDALPATEEHPMAARQRIPSLPANPPPLLQPILNHVSVHLGLDDLTLLDLRALDPPPALGSNLLMIIGTARSDKHLHVSADRLCRWLRSEPYFLKQVFADGLLGRNELKLKMRRKAKRSRLMAGVGTKTTTSGDGDVEEGIRTGWVCVNVGRVEGGELPEQLAERERAAEGSAIVGFGSQTGGCRIVVQMLTEEKRGEMDLERLWSGILGRSVKERAPEEVEEVVKEKGEGEDGKVGQVLGPAGVERREGGVVQREVGMTT